MNEMKQEHHCHAGPYWRRAHRDWRFYVGVFFMLLALVAFGTSYVFAGWSRPRHHQVSGIAGN